MSKLQNTARWLAALLTLLSALNSLEVRAEAGVYTVEAGPIYTSSVMLGLGQTVTIETRNPSVGAIPVLHLLETTPTSSLSQVAIAYTNLPNNQARLTFRRSNVISCTRNCDDPALDAPKSYTILMRSYSTTSRGTVDLYLNGVLHRSRAHIGGTYLPLLNLRLGDSIQSTSLPKGPETYTAYTLNSSGSFVSRRSGRIRTTIRTASEAATSLYLFVDGTTGPVRIVRNDLLANHDPDGDGLGSELEALIGTCSTTTAVVANWECSRSATAKDTDGDGLTDDAELLGMPTANLAFPRWGANPTHKDLFMEVDFMMRSMTETPRKPSPAYLRSIAATYGDRETDPLFRTLHAQSLGNPDGRPGISLHFDAGFAPAADAPNTDHTLYGDWGGYSVLPPICDASGCRGQSAYDGYHTAMNVLRRGYFRYGLVYDDNGGQCGESVACALPLQSSLVSAHELGHSLGLGHSGPMDPATLDANCKPNYPSLMNYVDLQMGYDRFSDGYGRPVLNNARLNEGSATVNPNSTRGREFLDRLAAVFGYRVDLSTGRVDWNRDGVFANGVVRAYANRDHRGTSCEFTRNNRIDLQAAATTSPALVRIGTTTAAFHLEGGRVYVAASLAPISCPSTKVLCDTTLASAAINAPWNSNIAAIDVQRLGDGASVPMRLLLVFRTNSGALWEVLGTGPTTWGPPAQIPTSRLGTGEVSLSGNGMQALLLFKDSMGLPILKTRPATGGAGGWSADAVAIDAVGAIIGPIAEDASPTLVDATTRGGVRVIYGLFPTNSNGTLELRALDPTTQRWVLTPWSASLRSGGTVGKPAIAVLPVDSASTLPGKIYVIYLHRNGPRTEVRETTLVATNTSGQTVTGFMTAAPFDNIWFYGYGLDLMYEPGIDTNLRALIAPKRVNDNDESTAQPLQLRWSADGAIDFDQRDWDDWKTLGTKLCQQLVDARGGGLACPQ